jgi:hypothetical protein
MIVTKASNSLGKITPRQHLITTLKDKLAGSAIADRKYLRTVVHRLYVNHRPDAANYPAARAFSISA